jgi:hypothetical protein
MRPRLLRQRLKYMSVDAGVYGDVMIPYWIFGGWALGMLIWFLVFYINDWFSDDILLGGGWMAVVIWPLSVIIGIGYLSICSIQKGWIIIGGPKIKRFAIDKRKFETNQKWEALNLAICEAKNIGIPGVKILKLATLHALDDTKTEEIAQIIRDTVAKEVHDS